MTQPTSPTSGAAPLDLDQYLPYRLSILSNTISSAIAAIYGERHGLSVAEWRIMAVLGMARQEPMTQKDLCARTRMDKVQVSRAVKRLLETGHLSRQVDRDDRRRAYLELSPQGGAVYDDVAPATLDWEQRMIDRLSDGEAADLDRMIGRLQTIADDIAAEVNRSS